MPDRAGNRDSPAYRKLGAAIGQDTEVTSIPCSVKNGNPRSLSESAAVTSVLVVYNLTAAYLE